MLKKKKQVEKHFPDNRKIVSLPEIKVYQQCKKLKKQATEFSTESPTLIDFVNLLQMFFEWLSEKTKLIL